MPSRPKLTKDLLLHRTPPHSPDAEMGVLASMMLDPTVASEVVEKVKDAYFYIPAHQTIFTLLKDDWEKGARFNLIAFTQKVSDLNLLDTIGGAAAITTIQCFVPTGANVGYYIEILRDKYILRQVIAAGTESVRRAYDEQDDVQGLLVHVHSSLQGIGEVVVASDGISLQVDRALEELEEDVAHKGKKDRIPTGLIDLDRILTIMPGDLVVIAGESSSGKTSLALNIVEHAALKLGLGALVFSIEMPSRQLIFRLMASQAKVNVLEAAQLSDQEKVMKLMDASARIKKAPIWIEDNPDVTALQIRARARKLCAEHDIKIIVPDYLQIVSNEGKRETTEAQELSDRTMSFKRMARELNAVVLLPSQIEETKGGTYGSRAIKHHADTVLKINQGAPATIYIDKQRNGPRDRFVKVNFMSQFTRFENYIEEQNKK